MLWMLGWTVVLCGRRGASTCCGAMVLTPPAAAAATGAPPPVNGAPPLTATVAACIIPAPLAAPGETCGDPVCAALWMTVWGDSTLIGTAGLALTLTGGWAFVSGAVPVAVATLGAAVSTQLALLLFPLMVKVAGCIDGLMVVVAATAVPVPPGALDTFALGAFTKDAWITVFEVEGAVTSPFAIPGPLLTTDTVTLTVAEAAGSLDVPLDAGVLSERGSIASPPSKVCTADVPSLTSWPGKVVTIAFGDSGSGYPCPAEVSSEAAGVLICIHS